MSAICLDCASKKLSISDHTLGPRKFFIDPHTEIERISFEEIEEQTESKTHDPVNSPKHYTDHPSGVECIQITEHMGFNLGNAVKYIWRCDLKKDAIEDLKKAKWYIEREISKREKEKENEEQQQ